MFALALSLSACKPDNGSAVPPPDGVKKVQLTSCLDESTFYLPGEGSDNFYLSLYAGEVDGNGEILLPEGTYTVAGNTDAGSACSDYTFALQYFEDGNVDYADPADGGTVVVRHTADGYSITARMDMVRSSTGESLQIDLVLSENTGLSSDSGTSAN